jgi:hypothetical protein
MPFAALLLGLAVPQHVQRLETTDVAAPIPGAARVVDGGAASPGAGAAAPGPGIPQMPGWPKLVGGNGTFAPTRGLAFADLDGDGPLEIVVSSTDGNLYAWNPDGSVQAGFPVALGNYAQSAPSIGDLDADGRPEIVQFTRGVTSGGRMWIVEHDGAIPPGFPKSFGNNNLEGSPTLADLDGDGFLEILVPERAYPIGYVHVVEADGTEWTTGWPQVLDHVPACSPAVGDVDADGLPEIVYESYDSLYVWNADGSPLPGWPKQLGVANFSYSSPALADIDGDGDLEIAVSTTGTGAAEWVLHHDGSQVWANPFGTWSYCPPSLVDVDGDGKYEVLASREGSFSPPSTVFWCWSDTGAIQFAYSATSGGGGGPITAADVDGDGLPELFADHNTIVSGQGYLIGVDRFGNDLPGFPLRPTGFTYMNGAQIADVDGDGDVELGVISRHDSIVEINLYDLPGTWAPAATPWPSYHVRSERGGVAGSTDALHVQGKTALGQPITVTVADEPGHDAFVAVGFSTGHFLWPGYGWIGLALSPAPIVLAAQTIPATGQFSFPVPIPPDPSGVGLPFYLQALSTPGLAFGGSFSNLIGKTIQP